MLVSHIRESRQSRKHPVLPTAPGMLPLSPLLFPNCLQRPLQKDLISPPQIHTHSPGPPAMGGRGQKVTVEDREDSGGTRPHMLPESKVRVK